MTAKTPTLTMPLVLEGADANLEGYLETLLAGADAGDYALPSGLLAKIAAGDAVTRRYQRVGAELANLDNVPARHSRRLAAGAVFMKAALAGDPLPEDITAPLFAEEARIDRLALEREVLRLQAPQATTEIVGTIRLTAEIFGKQLAKARRDLLEKAEPSARLLAGLSFGDPAALVDAPPAQQKAFAALGAPADSLRRIEATAWGLNAMVPDWHPAAFVGSGRIRPSEPGTSAHRQDIYHWTDNGHPVWRLIVAATRPVGPIGPRHNQQPIGAGAA